MTRDVLQIDDGVVDHVADDHRQRQQRDGLEVEAAPHHHDRGAEQRRGDRQSRNGRSAPVPQERIDHQCRDHDCLSQRLQGLARGGADVDALRLGQGQLHRVGCRALAGVEPLHGAGHRICHLQRVGVPALDDLDGHRRAAVHAHQGAGSGCGRWTAGARCAHRVVPAERVHLEHAGQGLDRRHDLPGRQRAEVIQIQRAAFHRAGGNDGFVQVDRQHIDLAARGQLQRLERRLDGPARSIEPASDIKGHVDHHLAGVGRRGHVRGAWQRTRHLFDRSGELRLGVPGVIDRRLGVDHDDRTGDVREQGVLERTRSHATGDREDRPEQQRQHRMPDREPRDIEALAHGGCQVGCWHGVAADQASGSL